MPARSNPRNMRVPIKRLDLIAAIERKRNQCQREYERVGSEHEREVEAERKRKIAEWRDEAKKLNAAADALAKKTAKGMIREVEKRSQSGYRSNYIDLGRNANKTFHVPTPREGKQLTGFDTVLRMLRMSDKPSISLTEEQFRAYMDGCPVLRQAKPGRETWSRSNRAR